MKEHFVVSILFFAAAAFGQPEFFPDKPGTWEQSMDRASASLLSLSAPESRVFGDKLELLAGILHRARVFNPPSGFQARLRESYAIPNGGERLCPNCPAGARLGLIIYYFVADRKGEPAWGGEANTSAEIELNDLAPTLGQDYDLWYEGLVLPDGRRVSRLPAKTGEVAGFPVYDRKRLIISGSSRPWWTPVTREQYLQALIRDRQKLVTESRSQPPEAQDPYQEWLSKRDERRSERQKAYASLKARDPKSAEQYLRTSEQMDAQIEASLKETSLKLQPVAPLTGTSLDLDALRDELATLPAGARASQAWWGGMNASKSGLVAEGTESARPLIALNTDFFDRSRSRTAIQLITVRFLWNDLPDEGPAAARHIGDRSLYQFMQDVDWKRIAAMLE